MTATKLVPGKREGSLDIFIDYYETLIGCEAATGMPDRDSMVLTSADVARAGQRAQKDPRAREALDLRRKAY